MQIFSMARANKCFLPPCCIHMVLVLFSCCVEVKCHLHNASVEQRRPVTLSHDSCAGSSENSQYTLENCDRLY